MVGSVHRCLFVVDVFVLCFIVVIKKKYPQHFVRGLHFQLDFKNTSWCCWPCEYFHSVLFEPPCFLAMRLYTHSVCYPRNNMADSKTEEKREKTFILLFDVDGTLTAARKEILDDMRSRHTLELSTSHHTTKTEKNLLSHSNTQGVHG